MGERCKKSEFMRNRKIMNCMRCRNTRGISSIADTPIPLYR